MSLFHSKNSCIINVVHVDDIFQCNSFDFLFLYSFGLRFGNLNVFMGFSFFLKKGNYSMNGFSKRKHANLTANLSLIINSNTNP